MIYKTVSVGFIIKKFAQMYKKSRYIEISRFG